jgi:uncharacterized coiled-coil DUF342 family protein
MDLYTYHMKAAEVKEKFEKLRNEMIAYARTEEGRKRISEMDKTAVRKLLRYPGDITIARLETLSRKMLAVV